MIGIVALIAAAAFVWGMFWRIEARDLRVQLDNLESSRDFWRNEYTGVALEAQAYRNHLRDCTSRNRERS